MFERAQSLPKVDKREKTDFDEFRLSHGNNNLGKKTLLEYQQDIEKMRNATFRARSFDRQQFEKKRSMSESKKDSVAAQAQRLAIEPFNLSTEQRGSKRRRWVIEEEKSNSSVEKKFKARPKPNYKFFEVKREEK